MKERLLGFVFCAILAAYAINLALDAIHHHWSQSPWFQAHWIVFFVAIPAVLLLGLAWTMGFFRRGTEHWGNALAIVVIGLVIYLMLGAGYSCWKYCF
jgi:hypothetical protein